MANEQLRAVGYCRTSGEGQRDNTSIPSQREQIRAFCDQNGWQLGRLYVDESKTGSKIDGRDEFQQMMRDAANDKFDIVVVFDTSRFGRDGVDILDSAKFLKSNFGIYTVCTKNQFDNRNNRNALQNFVQAGVAEHERLSIMERMMNGRIRQAQDGKPWTSCPPVGRAFNKNSGKWCVTDKGRAIAEVLRRYVEGESLKALCSELGVSRAAKISEWVLHGQLAGTYVAKFRSPEIEVDVDVSVPSMPEVVDPTLLERVKARLRHNRTFNRHDVRKYHLTGFIRCQDCGKALSGQTNGSTVYYRHRCPTCSIQSVRGDVVEQAVLDHLYDTFLDKPAFDEAVKRSMPSGDHRKELLKERARTEKQLAKNVSRAKRLVAAVQAGADLSELLDAQDALKAERATLTRRLEELDNEIATLPSAKLTRTAAMMARLWLAEEHQRKDWRSLPFEEVKQFLFHLFGTTTPKSGTGIFVGKDGKGRVVATFKGQVDFHHLVGNGRAVSKAMAAEAKRMNAKILAEYNQAVEAADREYHRELDRVRPAPGEQSPGATRPLLNTLAPSNESQNRDTQLAETNPCPSQSGEISEVFRKANPLDRLLPSTPQSHYHLC